MKTRCAILVVWVAYWGCIFESHAGNGLNDLFGIQLWGNGSLWNDVASDTANRLRLSDQEHQSLNQNQNNGYFRANLEKATGLKVMGARVYSLELYSTNQKVNRVIIGFVNKADLVREYKEGKAGEQNPGNVSSMQLVADFNERLQKERDTAFSGMSSQLDRRLGSASADSTSAIKHWTWNDNLLTLENTEMALTLRIEPTGGTANPASFNSAQHQKLNLRSRSNGDVVVSGIPPISQGPRGFCVPASWEKCLRYNGLNLDVYQLGDKGGTNPTGGSDFIDFAKKVQPLLEAKHFKMQLLKPQALGLDMIKTYIDQAAPLIWGLDARGLPYWVQRSRQRTSYLNDQAEGLMRDPWTGYGQPALHAILIIGYNPVVKEFALSDSTELGSGEPEIWIKEKDLLKAATPVSLVAVLPEDSRLLRDTRFVEPSTLDKKTDSTVTAPAAKKWY